ncbi:hypothetical protein EDD85DRAFT_920728 [Armillaria nabsnona]|nr:hypothetical protein EDD85DRAFT_920728 [Armillaria nabsnona]
MGQYLPLKPPPPPPKRHQKSPSPMPEPSPSPEPVNYFDTIPDNFGLFKWYRNTVPSTCPDDSANLESLADAPTFAIPPDASAHPDPTSIYGKNTGHTDFTDPSSSTSWFSPFLNASICRLMKWFYSSTTKTLSDLNQLVHEVILMPDFKVSDLQGFDAAREAECLDAEPQSEGHSGSPFWRDGWTEDFINIPLPLPNPSAVPNASNPYPEVQISNIWHRSLVDVIQSAFEDPQFSDFHIKGFTQMWNPPGCSHSEQIFGEVYTSEVFLEMEDSINPFPGCLLEAVVVPVMIYSDSTHLTNFGDASLWPAYVSLGLLSKYIQARVTSFLSHHLAYFPLTQTPVKSR